MTSIAQQVVLDELYIEVTLYTDGTWSLSSGAYNWEVGGNGFCTDMLVDIHADEVMYYLLDLLQCSDQVPESLQEELAYWSEYVCTFEQVI